jgi:hypothetical protein
MMQRASFAERLKACYSGAIHDVLRAKGHSKQTLPHHIRPLNRSHKLADLYSRLRVGETTRLMHMKAC